MQAVRFFCETVQTALGDRIKEALSRAALPPQTRQAKTIPRWTLKRLVQWVREKWKIDCCRETVSGVYIYNQATTRIFPYEKAETTNTIDVLKKLRTEFPQSKITLVWDGAPYHRAKLVKQAAFEMNINLEPLPGYSPDFLPVEHLWQWLREDVTYHLCYDSKQELIDAVTNFQHQINTYPLAISDRLWVQKHLELEEEKLRFSK